MNKSLESLPGLKRMIDVLKAHGVGADLNPPEPSAPQAGELVSGGPLDRVLAEIYSQFDGGTLGELVLYGVAPSHGKVVAMNRDILKNNIEPRFEKVFRFAKKFLLSYYLATVPSLADSNGVQPVVFVTDYVDKGIEPIASDADRALGLYALFIGNVLERTGDILGVAGIRFPYDFVDVIVQDTKLIQMIEAGRFDFLVSGDPDSRAWADKLMVAARAQR